MTWTAAPSDPSDAQPMKRSVTTRLGEFAVEALAGHGGKGSRHVAVRLVQAIRCYLHDRDSGKAGWPYPVFLRDREVSEGAELELSVDTDLWRSLEAEAVRQGVSTQQMVEHAALYTAAEVNAGRITQRILDDLEAGDS